MKALLIPPHAVFLDSCKHHCGEWNQITIQGYNSSSVVTKWFYQGSTSLPNNGYLDQAQPYPCASCCTPGA